ncbi:hypothetical protein PR202_gb08025 [Eleusine coracana subsp. coracana]|uniref:CCHC-type domain-containing protein n=1 Tax=Eleusine coracana subsp. coracana TaxID=191504 RepID=A0AAV5EDR3_ELECO|nr:hypothetical protein PR202_gb08025 [Eleusine coracana subsp. coracana]
MSTASGSGRRKPSRSTIFTDNAGGYHDFVIEGYSRIKKLPTGDCLKSRIGYPARRDEIRKFEHKARKVRRIGPPLPLTKSFAQDVEINHNQREVEARKRVASEDWMEEDDLLGPEGKEQDLRSKIQRNINIRQGGRFPKAFQQEEQTKHSYQGGRSMESHRSRYENRQSQGEGEGRGRPDLGRREHGAPPPKRSDQYDRGGDQDGKKKEDPRGRDQFLSKEIRCFHCQDYGHHQLECNKDPICYKCKKPGHMASECEGLKGRRLKMYGFGIRQGFNAIEISDAKNQSKETVALIKILEGDANEKRIEGELKNLIDNNWDWQVRKMSEDEYCAIFPNKQLLDTFSKLSKLLTKKHKLKIKVIKSELDPEATAMLHKVWIKIFGLPSFAKEEEVIKDITSLAAEPMAIDELSLIKSGLVRVQVRCQDPTQLRGFVEIFFNGVGYEIRFVVEGFHGKSTRKGDGPSNDGKDDKRRHHKRRDKSDEDESEDLYDEQDTKTEWEKGKERERSQSEAADQTDPEQGDTHKESVGGYYQMGSEVQPIAYYDPMEEMVVSLNYQDKETTPNLTVEDNLTGMDEHHFEEDDIVNIGTRKEQESQLRMELPIEVDNSDNHMRTMDESEKSEDKKDELVVALSDKPYKSIQLDLPETLSDDEQALLNLQEHRENSPELILVHNQGGPFFMKKCKWPNLASPKKRRKDKPEEEILCEVETIEDNNKGVSKEEKEMKATGHGWPLSLARKKTKKTRVKKFTEPTRRSTRILQDGVPILKKASTGAKVKNLESEGTTPSNPFLILGETPDDVISSIIESLDIEMEDRTNVINTIKSEEALRAAIAEAKYKEYIKKREEKKNHHDCEDMEILAM